MTLEEWRLLEDTVLSLHFERKTTKNIKQGSQFLFRNKTRYLPNRIYTHYRSANPLGQLKDAMTLRKDLLPVD